MKYQELDDGHIVLITLQDSFDTHGVFNNIEEKATENVVLMSLGNGWFDGDQKDIILAQNDHDRRIRVNLPIQTVTENKTDQYYALEMRLVGESCSLIWSSRFSKWFIRGVGCNVV